MHFIPAEERGYTVVVPALPGCRSEGDTLPGRSRGSQFSCPLFPHLHPASPSSPFIQRARMRHWRTFDIWLAGLNTTKSMVTESLYLIMHHFWSPQQGSIGQRPRRPSDRRFTTPTNTISQSQSHAAPFPGCGAPLRSAGLSESGDSEYMSATM